MFTGLVEEIGTIKQVKSLSGGMEITVNALKVLEGLALGDSMNINGACQTVTEFDKNSFKVTAVEETLKKTNLGKLKTGSRVNLERSLTMNKRLGGHFVMGHVDTTGKILSIRKLSTSYLLEVSYPKEFSKYIINVGAIAIEGISLTIAGFTERSLTVSIIPHTWTSTNLSDKAQAMEVNLEFDVLGKYVAKILSKDEASGITGEWIKQNGF
ncbi:MAG: riboflavin synthase [Bacteroidota bacterium]|jgi:riboflavin synthase|nr:riboflavin synthase [Ignavibacteria bacterium]MCU7499890.1 riboflavin synthase [Ignavibacteria bacterium]MCU7513814.1 riboflavin synthase [Ignavibacteria bacterium]MCU7522343.1 riboflavin synthase [Ignavibacteria bacterium]MCU7526278.1 riboflavin synthase [Ignavibacteria bacterium]